MVKRFEKQDIIDRFKTEISKGQAIFDAFAGTGIFRKHDWSC